MMQRRMAVLAVMFCCGSVLGAQASTFDRQAERDMAIMKGLTWLSAYLVDEDHFRDVSFDTFCIFQEIQRTSHDPLLEQWCESTAYMYGKRLKHYCSLFRDPLRGYHALEMLRFTCATDYDRIGFKPVYEKAKASLETYKTDEQVYWINVDNIDALSEAQLLNLLLRAYYVEKIELTHPVKIPVKYRLPELLCYLKKKPLIAYEDDPSVYKELWRDHCFLATHIVLVLNNYTEFKLKESDVPWAFKYIRENFMAAFARNDVELIGEFLDCLRSLGLTAENDEMVRLGTEFLLDTQNADGSWSIVEPLSGKTPWRPYHIMHPTWCAVVGLRPRTYLENTPFEKRIREILAEVNQDGK